MLCTRVASYHLEMKRLEKTGTTSVDLPITQSLCVQTVSYITDIGIRSKLRSNEGIEIDVRLIEV